MQLDTDNEISIQKYVSDGIMKNLEEINLDKFDGDDTVKFTNKDII